MNLSNHLGAKIFRIVREVAIANKTPIYVVGGFVRDILLQRSSQDIDFVCVGNGIEAAENVAQKLGKQVKVTVFKKFGTAHIKFEDLELEFVGARKESYQRDSRKPIVEDGTLEEDQHRRDFTINAMAISLNENFGELLDPFDGQKHLKRKSIITPLKPTITFSDDPLRMMRAIRFATQLQFDIEADTFAAIIMHKDRLSIVSQERITEELNKIIAAKTPSYGFKLLFHSGLLQLVFPEMIALLGVDTVNGNSHKDNFYHTLEVLDNTAKNTSDLWLRWAAILHDIAKPATKRYDEKVGWTFHGHEDKGARMVPKLFRKLKLPMNEKMDFVQKLVRLHLRPIALVQNHVTDTAIRRLLFEAGNDVEALMLLCRADVTSKNYNKAQHYLNNFDRVEQKMKEVEAKDRVKNFQPPVSGEEIMKAFDLNPSRVIGEIKEAIKKAILEGTLQNNKKEAYEYMLYTGQKKGLTISKK